MAEPVPARSRVRKVVVIAGAAVLLAGSGGVAIALSSDDEPTPATAPVVAPSSGPLSTAPITTPAPRTPVADRPSTRSSEPTPAPAPPTGGTTTTAPVPADRTFTGTGSEVVRLPQTGDVTRTATIRHNGAANFVVATVDSDGDQVELLVNEIGSYVGTRLIDPGAADVRALKVTADGSWTIVVRAVSKAPLWTGRSTGRGDAVVRTTPADDLVTVRLTHDGDRNFTVWAHHAAGPDLLVNEIGDYRGEVALPAATVLLAITADGAWAVRRT